MDQLGRLVENWMVDCFSRTWGRKFWKFRSPLAKNVQSGLGESKMIQPLECTRIPVAATLGLLQRSRVDPVTNWNLSSPNAFPYPWSLCPEIATNSPNWSPWLDSNSWNLEGDLVGHSIRNWKCGNGKFQAIINRFSIENRTSDKNTNFPRTSTRKRLSRNTNYKQYLQTGPRLSYLFSILGRVYILNNVSSPIM